MSDSSATRGGVGWKHAGENILLQACTNTSLSKEQLYVAVNTAELFEEA